MKKILNVFFLIAIIISLSSCVALHLGLPSNVNSNTTNVVLQSNNYRVIQKVSGSANGTSVFGVGGDFRPLIENARSDMLKGVDFIGKSRALINESVEKNSKNYLGVVTINTVTVSAYLIEFTD